MKLIRQIQKNEDGTYDASWKLSQEQVSYLISYAIADLMDKGVATIEDDFLQNTDAVGSVQ